MNNKIDEMRRINERQHEYYEKADGSSESPLNTRATNTWRRMRRNAFSVFRNAEIRNSLLRMHTQWIGDVSRAKVLDLGLGEGNPLSLKLAAEAGEYVAIDLSSTRMKIFQRKLNEAGLKGAKTYICDFLSDDFPETDFDLVYAMSVFHHFRHIDDFLEALSRRMSTGGLAVTRDPLQTWLPLQLIRFVYRRFQTGADWEFPFTWDSIRAIQRKFDIECVQGIYGYSKWAMPISLFRPNLAQQLAERWHAKDLRHATTLSAIGSCLRVSFLLRKPV